MTDSIVEQVLVLEPDELAAIVCDVIGDKSAPVRPKRLSKFSFH